MKYSLLIFCFLFSVTLKASNVDTIYFVLKNENSLFAEVKVIDQEKKLEITPTENKKKFAAFLSFPFPLGMLGAHRIYMGAKPYIPVIYIATLGGCLGILPLIDFIVIMSHKDIEPYRNDKVFMWLK